MSSVTVMTFQYIYSLLLLRKEIFNINEQVIWLLWECILWKTIYKWFTSSIILGYNILNILKMLFQLTFKHIIKSCTIALHLKVTGWVSCSSTTANLAKPPTVHCPKYIYGLRQFKMNIIVEQRRLKDFPVAPRK